MEVTDGTPDRDAVLAEVRKALRREPSDLHRRLGVDGVSFVTLHEVAVARDGRSAERRIGFDELVDVMTRASLAVLEARLAVDMGLVVGPVLDMDKALENARAEHFTDVLMTLAECVKGTARSRPIAADPRDFGFNVSTPDSAS